MRKTLLVFTLVLAAVVAAPGAAAPPADVTISASKPVVVTGQSVTLSGTISSKQSGQPVIIKAQAVGKTVFSDLATVTTGDKGTWSYVATPTIQTTFQAMWMTSASQMLTIKVRPKVVLSLVSAATRRFSVAVTGDHSFQGKYVLVQRVTPNGATAVKRVTLDATSSATFRVRLHARVWRLRAVIPTSQAAPGYITGMSNVLRFRR